MLLILRVIFIVIYCILVSFLGSIYCLFSPRNPRHVATFAHLFGHLSKVLRIKVEVRKPADAHNNGKCIYIANHQSNYDMVTTANAVQSGTVTVGKKSLVWIPFFGPLYWLTGNLLIDRDNKVSAHGTITQIVEAFKKKDMSIWIFPEGSRSRGRGLLPFKTGAFRAAIAAGVPIVPICVSTTIGKIKLNRWNNGHAIVEMLEPIDIRNYSKDQVRELMAHCHDLMKAKIKQLDAEVAQREAEKK